MKDLPRFNLLGSSPQFQRVYAQIEKMARVDATVLIAGETGTGKEMAARAIHYMGSRCDHPFIPVNCGALAETLIESELFGHERGAFTDAKAASPGLISEANGGTLFLDEIDALSPKAQAAMLRFLQDRTYRRVGSGVTRQADVRVIVASNAHLEQMVEERRFRSDLLYRLNVLTLRMPALREREGDSLELAQVFLTRFARQYRAQPKTFHPDSLSYIGRHAWPGNVRELENAVHRGFLMSEGSEVILDGAPEANTGTMTSQGFDVSFKLAKARAIADFERRYVGELLDRTDGNITRAARLAGQDRSAFGKLARKHGLGQAVVSQAVETAE